MGKRQVLLPFPEAKRAKSAHLALAKAVMVAMKEEALVPDAALPDCSDADGAGDAVLEVTDVDFPRDGEDLYSATAAVKGMIGAGRSVRASSPSPRLQLESRIAFRSGPLCGSSSDTGKSHSHLRAHS